MGQKERNRPAGVAKAGGSLGPSPAPEGFLQLLREGVDPALGVRGPALEAEEAEPGVAQDPGKLCRGFLVRFPLSPLDQEEATAKHPAEVFLQDEEGGVLLVLGKGLAQVRLALHEGQASPVPGQAVHWSTELRSFAQLS